MSDMDDPILDGTPRRNIVLQGVRGSTPGGTEYLVSNLIAENIKNTKSPVRVFSTAEPDTFLSHLMKNRGQSDRIVAKSGLNQVLRSKSDLFVSWGYAPEEVLDISLKVGDASFALWIIQEGALVKRFYRAFLPGLRTYCRRLALQMFSDLSRNNALFFMDGNCRSYVESFCGKQFDCGFLPVPIKAYLDRRSEFKSTPGIPRVTYCGRSTSVWKIWPAELIARTLNRLRCNFNVEVAFTIITDNAQPYQQIIGTPSFIDYRTDLSESNLHRFLRDNSFLHISMGTAALDGACVGVPTLLIDPSNGPLPDSYAPKWLFDTQDFSLGSFSWHEHQANQLAPIADVLKMLRDDPSFYSSTSERSMNYVTEFHSTSALLEKLANTYTTFRVADFSRRFKKLDSNRMRKLDFLLFDNLAARGKRALQRIMARRRSFS